MGRAPHRRARFGVEASAERHQMGHPTHPGVVSLCFHYDYVMTTIITMFTYCYHYY